MVEPDLALPLQVFVDRGDTVLIEGRPSWAQCATSPTPARAC
jgi:hypothetical protein